MQDHLSFEEALKSVWIQHDRRTNKRLHGNSSRDKMVVKIGCKKIKKKGENKMHEIIEFQFAYAGWATEKLFVVLEKISKEEYNAPGCSGHGSIRDTLAHCFERGTGVVFMV